MLSIPKSWEGGRSQLESLKVEGSDRASLGQIGGARTSVVEWMKGRNEYFHVLERIKTPNGLGPIVLIVIQDNSPDG